MGGGAIKSARCRRDTGNKESMLRHFYGWDSQADQFLLQQPD